MRAGRDTLVYLGVGCVERDTWARRSHCASRSANRGTRTATSRAVDRLEKWLPRLFVTFSLAQAIREPLSRYFFRDIRMTMGRKKLYASATERKRAQRARESAARSHQLDARPPVVAVVDHAADPVGALASWAREKLIVPPGHPRSGEPMTLPDFAVDWLRASWSSHESALSTARKNAKSAIAAVLALGYLVRSAAASWLARRGRQFGQGQGGGVAAAGCRDCGRRPGST